MKLHPELVGVALFRHVWSWNVTAISLSCWSESEQKAIREQLVRILNSGPFLQSRRRARFLEYLVNETLAGRGERLKGYNVALEVFEYGLCQLPGADTGDDQGAVPSHRHRFNPQQDRVFLEPQLPEARFLIAA
jgi:hypothetical protein